MLATTGVSPARDQNGPAPLAAADHVRLLAEAIPQIVWFAGPDGRCHHVNGRWTEYTGLGPEAAADPAALAEVVHPGDLAAMYERFARAIASGETFEAEFRLRGAADGAYRWFLTRAVPVRDDAGRLSGWVGTSTDIDEARRAEGWQRFLAEAGEVLASSLDLDSTLGHVARLAVPRLADWCAFRVVGDDGSLDLAAIHHADPARIALVDALYRRYPPDPAAPHGPHHVLRTGRPEFLPEIGDAELVAAARDAEHLRLMRALSFRSYMSLPLVARGRTLGVLSLMMAESGRRYGREELAMAEELARRAAAAVDNARLYREAQEALRRRDEAHALADALLAAAPVGVAFLDRDLRYVRINRVLAEANGHPAEAHIGRTVREVLDGEIAGQLEEVLRGVLDTGRPVVDLAFRARSAARPDREGHWLATFYPATGPDGAVAGVGAMVVEVTDRVLAERGQRRGEALLRRLVESDLFGVTFGQLDGRVSYANDYFLRMLGYDRDDLARGDLRWDAATATEALDQDDRKRAEMRRRGVVEPFEKEYRRKDGSRVTALVGATLLPADEDREETVIGFFLDLSDRKRSERLMERYRLLSQHARDIVLFIRADGRIAEANDAAVAAYGYAHDELLGLSVFDLRDPATSPNVPGQMLQADAAGITFETAHRRKDGSTFPVEVSSRGAPIAGERLLLSIIRDITERHRAEEERRQGERRLRSLTDAVALLMWANDPEGRTTYYNGRWREYTGLDPATLVDMNWLELVHPDDVPRLMERRGAGIAAGEPYEIDYRFRRHDGQYRWHLGRTVPVKDSQGRVEGWFGTATDVHDRRLAEEELRAARDAAEAGSRAKSQFLAVLSHELRTPLTPVLAEVTALLDRTDTPEPLRPVLELTRRNVELEARIIDDLLDVNRIAQGKLHLNRCVVDAHELVRRAVEICRDDIAGRDLRLVVDLAAPAHHVHADPARVQQIAWNLIKNAAKFTPAGGTVAVRSCQDDDGGLVVEVADTGVGIDAAALPRIFEAFEQADPGVAKQFGGLGLGLAISRSLAEAHGGSLSADSPGWGRGATFRLRLPTTAPDAAIGPERPRPAGPARPLRLLLVEDNRDTLHVLSRLLAGQGHRVSAAATVAAALEVAAADGPFDLVISDIGLPDGSGLDLMRRLHAAGHAAPGIALSGFGMEEDLLRSRAAGFVAHLTKPVDFAALQALIRESTAGDRPTRR